MRSSASRSTSEAEQEPAPVQRSFLCLVLPAPRLPRRATGARAGSVVSISLHVVVVTAIVFAAAGSGFVATSPETAPNHQSLQLPRMVLLQMSGPAGGGGGGGTRQASPPSRASAIGRDRLTMQVTKPVIPSDQPQDETRSTQPLLLDATPLASGTTLITGLPDAAPSPALSLGVGSGGGAGDGRGSGIGSGTGPGVGPGSGGGFGGNAYRPGSGVAAPTLVTQVRPKYTAEALQRKIQGTVVLEVVVGREGVHLAIRVTRSLDPGGLDEEAIAAVREWRFTPGRVGDTPVDVLVTILLDFHIV